MAKKQLAAVGLAAIVAATQASAEGYVFTSPTEHGPLVAAGLVEINTAITDKKSDGIATRATQAGIDKVAAEQSAGSPEEESDEDEDEDEGSGFEIESDVAIPAITGRGRTGTTYPFDKLEIGQSFYVDKASKNLASTVSSANARYAEPVNDAEGKPIMVKNKKGELVPKTRALRKFIVRSVDETAKGRGKGSRIWRVQPKD